MKIDDSIKVKKRVISPDYDGLNIGDWQGRIVEIENDIVTFELDSITLSKLSENYIIDSLAEDIEWKLLSLELCEVEITQPQDSKTDVLQNTK